MLSNTMFMRVFGSGQQETQKAATAVPDPCVSDNLTNPKLGSGKRVYGVVDHGSAANAKSHKATCEKTDKRAP